MEEESEHPFERLSQMRVDKAEERARGGSRSTVAVIALIAVAGLIALLPSLMAPESYEDAFLKNLQRFCIGETNRAECEVQVSERHAVCAERARKADSDQDVYGPCMDDAFPNFVLTVSQSLNP